VAAISCGVCLFNSHTGNAPSPVALSADTQLLQAQRLLADIHTAVAQAQAALEYYNRPPCHNPPAVNPALAAAAAAYLGSLPEATAAAAGSAVDSGGSPAVQLGGALFCCQAAVALQSLSVDLSGGISCCEQLYNELLSVLTQVSLLLASTLLAASHLVHSPCCFHNGVQTIWRSAAVRGPYGLIQTGSNSHQLILLA